MLPSSPQKISLLKRHPLSPRRPLPLTIPCAKNTNPLHANFVKMPGISNGIAPGTNANTASSTALRPKAHAMRLHRGCTTPDHMVCLTCTQEGHFHQDCEHYRCRYCHHRTPSHLSRNCHRRACRIQLLQCTCRRRQQQDLFDRMEDPNNGQYNVYFEDNMDGEC